jgi:hypothetical protein
MGDERSSLANICIFCLGHRDSGIVWCSYGMHHEYPAAETKPKQGPKPDKALCSRCGLHPKNPVSATNGCEHDYGTARGVT